MPRFNLTADHLTSHAYRKSNFKITKMLYLYWLCNSGSTGSHLHEMYQCRLNARKGKPALRQGRKVMDLPSDETSLIDRQNTVFLGSGMPIK